MRWGMSSRFQGPALKAVSLVVGTWLAACASGGAADPEGFGQLGSLPRVPRVDAKDVEDPELHAAIASFLQVETRAVRVEKLIGWPPNQAAALFRYGSELEKTGAVTLREESVWRVEDSVLNVWDETRPTRGSRSYPLVPLQAGDLVVVSGFIDPALTEMRSVDAGGSTVDSDRPAKGATLVVGDEWVQLSGYAEDKLIFSTTLASQELSSGRPLSEAAQQQAESFLNDVLSGRWVSAASALPSALAAKNILAALRRLLGSFDEVQIGPPVVSEGAVTFSLRSAALEATIALYLNVNGDAWEAWNFIFTAH